MTNNLEFKYATFEDLEEVTAYRMKLWQDAGKFHDQGEYDEFFRENYQFLREYCEQKKLCIPMYTDRDTRKIISIGIGIILKKPPINRQNRGSEGYVYNIFTEKEYRRQGLAASVVKKLFSWFQEQGVCRTYLTSNEGSYKLYEGLGMKGNPWYQEIVFT